MVMWTDCIECVLVWIPFRCTDGVIPDRYGWQLPENVRRHQSTHVTSPVAHMEGRWTWRWACDCHFKLSNWSVFGLRNTDIVRLSVWSWCPRCRCERYVSAEELCNATCFSRLLRIRGRFSEDGHLLLSLKERDGVIWVGEQRQLYGFIFDNSTHYLCSEGFRKAAANR